MDIVQGTIGPEAKYEIDFQDGKMVAKVEYAGKEGGAGMNLYLNADLILDKMKEKFLDPLKKEIRGEVDDMVIDMMFLKMKEILK